MKKNNDLFTTEYELLTEICSYCGDSITGYKNGQFLWPRWIEKDNSIKFPNHGPRIYNYQCMMCWNCSIKQGDDWHR